MPYFKAPGWAGLIRLPPAQHAVFSNPQGFALVGLFNRIDVTITFAWYLITTIKLLRNTRTAQPSTDSLRTGGPHSVPAADKCRIY